MDNQTNKPASNLDGAAIDEIKELLRNFGLDIILLNDRFRTGDGRSKIDFETYDEYAEYEEGRYADQILALLTQELTKARIEEAHYYLANRDLTRMTVGKSVIKDRLNQLGAKDD